MARYLSSSSVFHVTSLLLVILKITSSKAQECESRSYELPDPPDSVCTLSVEVRRREDCSAVITEKIKYPHTVGTDFLRDVKLLKDFQKLSDAKLWRGNEKLDVKSEDIGKEDLRFILPSKRNITEPVEFTLSYNVTNVAMKFNKECENSGGRFDSDNVIRWSSGLWAEDLEQISVRFITENADAKLSLVGSREDVTTTTESETDMWVSSYLRDGNRWDIYVREIGAEACSQDLRCFDEELEDEDEDIIGGGWGGFLRVAGIVAGALVGTILLCCVGYRLCVKVLEEGLDCFDRLCDCDCFSCFRRRSKQTKDVRSVSPLVQEVINSTSAHEEKSYEEKEIEKDTFATVKMVETFTAEDVAYRQHSGTQASHAATNAIPPQVDQRVSGNVAQHTPTHIGYVPYQDQDVNVAPYKEQDAVVVPFSDKNAGDVQGMTQGVGRSMMVAPPAQQMNVGSLQAGHPMNHYEMTTNMADGVEARGMKGTLVREIEVQVGGSEFSRQRNASGLFQEERR